MSTIAFPITMLSRITGKGKKINDIFVQKSEALRAARLPGLLFDLNTKWFLKWLIPVFIGLFIYKDAHNVLSGEMSIGAFLATQHVIQLMVGQFLVGYRDFKGVLRSNKPLERMSTYFNMQTELKKWKQINRKRRNET